MKVPGTARLVAMAAVCGGAFGASLLTLAALNSGGAVKLGPVELMPVAAGYDRRAQDRLAGAVAPPAESRREAQMASRQAIGQFPYDTSAWLRLAYVDTLEHGQLTPAGVAMLARSYDLVGVDPDFGIWRVAFALEHSQALPRPLLASVREEVDALWRAYPDRGRLLNLRKQLRNPTGRLSLLLWINRLQAADAK